MDNKLNRRDFLTKTGLASLGLVAIGPLKLVGASLHETIDLPSYVDLRKSKLFGEHLVVTGKVFDETSLEISKNTVIEISHLCPDGKNITHRAKMKTDNSGKYQFITDLPGKTSGKGKHILFKITNPNDSYTTELVLSETDVHVSGQHWEKNGKLGKAVFPKRDLKAGSINFDFCI